MQEVIGEIFLDQVALVAATNHEIIYSVLGVNLHDVPQDGAPTDFNHRLWLEVCLFRDTGSETTS
jgi:hypothetical protein